MPIRKGFRWFYPIDWIQRSHYVRFVRAGGRCEHCRRPHGKLVAHLGDGRWLDRDDGIWRNGRGRKVAWIDYRSRGASVRWTRVILATAHLDHNPSNGADSNLKALCQRCHMIHDRPERQRQRRLTYLMRRALGDLFLGRYQRW